jgi:hypothetical protein
MAGGAVPQFNILVSDAMFELEFGPDVSMEVRHDSRTDEMRKAWKVLGKLFPNQDRADFDARYGLSKNRDRKSRVMRRNVRSVIPHATFTAASIYSGGSADVDFHWGVELHRNFVTYGRTKAKNDTVYRPLEKTGLLQNGEEEREAGEIPATIKSICNPAPCATVVTGA